jgi:hypothetical protein
MEILISTQKSTHWQIMHLFNMKITWIFLEINNFSTFPKQVNWRMITMAPTVDIPFGWCLHHHTFDKHLMMWLFWKIPRYWHFFFFAKLEQIFDTIVNFQSRNKTFKLLIKYFSKLHQWKAINRRSLCMLVEPIIQTLMSICQHGIS